MAIYANFGKIKGSTTAEGYKDMIEFTDFQLGSGRQISMEVGKGTERESTKPAISQITLNKRMDKSSPDFFIGALAGKALDKVEINFAKTSKGALETYTTYTLENVLVDNYTVTGYKEGHPEESVSLAYTKIEMKYHPRKSDNTKDSPIPVGYDVDKGAKV